MYAISIPPIPALWQELQEFRKRGITLEYFDWASNVKYIYVMSQGVCSKFQLKD